MNFAPAITTGTWLLPIRDRARLAGALPELQTPGVSFALALARAESNSESFGWWSRLFLGDWLNRRLGAPRDMTQIELQILREVRSSNPPDSLARVCPTWQPSTSLGRASFNLGRHYSKSSVSDGPNRNSALAPTLCLVVQSYTRCVGVVNVMAAAVQQVQ